MKKDYFEILQIKPPASEEDIKQAYRNLAKKFHPDVNPEPDAHVRFLEISEAYEYLLEELRHMNRKTIHDQDETFNHEYFEEMRRRARERAQEKARMRLEKLQKEHEAFQESGWYDVVLLLSYAGRYVLLLLCVGLIAAATMLSFGYTNTPYAVRAIMIIAGCTGLYFILKAGKSFFFAGKFYYTYKQIKKVLTFRDTGIEEPCFYSPRFIANSLPYKINMIKIKDIQLKNYGPGQHTVAFNQKSITLSIPRSHHALMVHVTIIMLKVFILLGCLFFLDIASILWRVIIAIAISFVISKLILLVTGTKSTASYLVTPGIIIRGTFWLLFISIFSFFQFRPFNIFTSDMMYGIVVFMLFFDSFFDQFLNFISRKKLSLPVFKQPPVIESYLEKKYQFGYDMPVLSVLHPVYKWFLG